MDHSGLGTTWLVNGTNSLGNDNVKLDIVTNGVPSRNSSLTIPGYPQYNNTVVICNAVGYVNGNIYINSSQSTLRIQGIDRRGN